MNGMFTAGNRITGQRAGILWNFQVQSTGSARKSTLNRPFIRPIHGATDFIPFFTPGAKRCWLIQRV